MADLLQKIPDWLKSLHHMETELRRAARHGLIFRWKEACEHLAEARGHLEQAVRDAKGEAPPEGPGVSPKEQPDAKDGAELGRRDSKDAQ